MSIFPRDLRLFGPMVLSVALLGAGCAAADGGDEYVSPKAPTHVDSGRGPATDETAPYSGADGGSLDTAVADTASETSDDAGDPDTGDPDTGAPDPPDTDPGPPPPDPGDSGGTAGACASDSDCSTPFDCCDTTTGNCGFKVFGFCVAP
jgi:hypothetical protein